MADATQGAPMDPEMMDLYLELAGMKGQEGDINRQRMMAEQLRQMNPGAQGTTGSGRGFTPARSALESIAVPMMSGIGSGVMQNRAQQADNAYQKQRLGAIGDFRNRRRQPMTPSAGAFPMRPMPGEEDTGLPY